MDSKRGDQANTTGQTEQNTALPTEASPDKTMTSAPLSKKKTYGRQGTIDNFKRKMTLLRQNTKPSNASMSQNGKKGVSFNTGSKSKPPLKK